jgi:DNA mismatch repair protein MutL
MPIRILSDDVASQIAAGEVVERPASVVKELLENALDAGASQITIKVERAGRGMIEVSDDGMGISPSELLLAVGRHATSKLSSAEDLFHIKTLGFRGEALASIASVSRFTLVSRQPARAGGASVTVDGGRVGNVQELGAPVGTQVRVEDLFFNVPARLKFLKQDSTERQQIDGLVTRYALAYPHVRFHLQQDGKAVLQTTGSGNRREVLAHFYGLEIARQMLEVIQEDQDLRLTGFTSPVALTRSNRRDITFFINGRWVQDVALTSALVQAYHTYLMVGRYPLAALFIQLPPEEVDVNVHPAKEEVRFRHSDVVFSAVQRAVRRALLAYSPVPAMGGTSWRLPSTGNSPEIGWDMAGELKTAVPAQSPLPDGESGQVTNEEDDPPSGQIPLLRLIGQVGLTYLIAEGPDGLYLIDQHAAHERVLFERLLKQGQGKVPSQALLEPAVVNLPPAGARIIQDQLNILAHFGFEVELFGPNTFQVRSLPVLLSRLDPASALRVIVEDFEEDETPLQNTIEERLIARICKRAAVKGGQALTMDEQQSLISDLERCHSPRTCPHGRPTMIHLSVDLLERQFGRRGSR